MQEVTSIHSGGFILIFFLSNVLLRLSNCTYDLANTTHLENTSEDERESESIRTLQALLWWLCAVTLLNKEKSSMD